MSSPQLVIVCATVLLITAAILAAVLERGKAATKRAVHEQLHAETMRQPPAAASRFAGLKPGQEVGIQLLDSTGQSIKGVIAAAEAEYLELTTAQLVTGHESATLGTVRVAADIAKIVQRIRSE